MRHVSSDYILLNLMRIRCPILERKHEWFCYTMTCLFAKSVMLFQAWKRSGGNQSHRVTGQSNHIRQ
jgi:hypothetical protein